MHILIESYMATIAEKSPDVWERIPEDVEFSSFFWMWLRDYCVDPQHNSRAYIGSLNEYVAYFDDNGDFHAHLLSKREREIADDFFYRAMGGAYPELVSFIVAGCTYEVYMTDYRDDFPAMDVSNILELYNDLRAYFDMDIEVRYK